MTQLAKRDSIAQSIAIISKPSASKLTPAQAWQHGMNVTTAFKHEPKLTHVALMALLKDAVEYLDYNKTITKTGDYIEAVDYLIQRFPVMKIEEWKVIMTRLKAVQYGKMYERLKLPELVEIFQQYEGERAEMMERNIQRQKDEPQAPLSAEQKQLFSKLIEQLDLPEPKTQKRWKWIVYPTTPDHEGNYED